MTSPTADLTATTIAMCEAFFVQYEARGPEVQFQAQRAMRLAISTQEIVASTAEQDQLQELIDRMTPMLLPAPIDSHAIARAEMLGDEAAPADTSE
jgi:hypothetical protein